jgi:phosphoglycerate dehydrogenase-like enzyme
MQQRSHPIVVVLDSGESPPDLTAIKNRAAIRFTTDERLADELPGAEVLLVWSTRSGALTRAWPKADALRWTHIAGSSIGRLLPADMTLGEVIVTTSRGMFDEPVAEYVLGLILTLAKDLRKPYGQRRNAERIAGKDALIVGTGTISRAIGRMLTAVGMRVTGIGRMGLPADPDLGEIVPMDRWLDALRHTDYLILAAPVTTDTRGILNGSALAVMKPTVRVINVGRMALVTHADLAKALSTGRIAGAALDVFADERLAESSPLWQLPNVVISPHMSGQVVGWREELTALFVDNLDRYLSGRPLRNMWRPGTTLL